MISIFIILDALKSINNLKMIISLDIVAVFIIIVSLVLSFIIFRQYKKIYDNYLNYWITTENKFTYKDYKIKKFTKISYVIILLIAFFHLTIGSLVGVLAIYGYKEDIRYKEHYGTIQLFLNNSKYSNYYYINPSKNGKKDENGIIYDKLYVLAFEEIKRDEFEKHIPCQGFYYHIPYDDSAYIYLNNSGYGYISICPDLSPSYNYYFKTNSDDAYDLYLLIKKLLDEK